MARKGPPPSPEAWLAHFTPAQRAVADAVRAAVDAAAGPVSERVRVGWNILGFDLVEGDRRLYFAYLGRSKAGEVELCLVYGVHLDDPEGLLEAGPRKMVRAITCRSPADAARPAVEDLIARAADVAMTIHAHR